MAKKTLLACLFGALLASAVGAAPQPWGTLNKIQLFHAWNQADAMRLALQELDPSWLPRDQQQQIVAQLLQLGDQYLQRQQFDRAAEFYHKALAIRPATWQVLDNLEQINKANGSVFPSVGIAARQLPVLASGFASSFLLLNGLLNSLYFAALLVTFIFAMLMLWNYFLVAATDVAGGPRGVFSLRRLLLLVALLAWPALLAGGWGFFPFLLLGTLTVYLSPEERSTTRLLVGLLLAASVLTAFNRTLENTAATPEFNTVQRVFRGEIMPERVWRRFDNGLKTVQAFAAYEQGKPALTLDILDSTGPGYRDPLKFDLLGNIHLEMGNAPQSIQNYRESLTLEERNPVTQKNFTLALLKGGDTSLFAKYAERYPDIDGYRKTVTGLQAIPLNEGFLWSRLLNASRPSFHWPIFLQHLLLELLRLPAVIGLLLFGLYRAAVPRLFPSIGQSVFCARCRKIIHKSHVDQAHALCDECFQLFLIKDPIFLEAKIIKEKEIHRRRARRYLAFLLLSLFIPGFNLLNKDRGRWFVLGAWPFTLLLTFAFSAASTFRGAFGSAPMLIGFAGIAAWIVYLLVNLFSVRGDEDGF